jgi:hypothetical protein
LPDAELCEFDGVSSKDYGYIPQTHGRKADLEINGAKVLWSRRRGDLVDAMKERSIIGT